MLCPIRSPNIATGALFGRYLRTAKGKREEHPAVIISPDRAIIQPKDFDPRSGNDNVVVVAGISTKYRSYSSPYVQLPFRASKDSHPATWLQKDCAAIIGWYQALFIPDDITAFSGDVPPAQMRELNKKIFTDYIAAVGDQYTSALEMLAEMREILIRTEFPPK